MFTCGKAGDEPVPGALPLQCLWPEDFLLSCLEGDVLLGQSSWNAEEGFRSEREL